MLRLEAAELARLLTRFPAEALSPCLNLGSGTRGFREMQQPYIQNLLFEPLVRHGIRIIHADLKAGDGIDVSGDVFDAGVQARLRQLAPRSVICSNMLEHVRDRPALATICRSLLAPGGVIAVTVPRSYPYHSDPIDTLYRPTPEEIAGLFPDFVLRYRHVVSDGSFREQLSKTRGGLAVGLSKWALRLMSPFYRPSAWLSYVHATFWLWRPYQVSVAVLQKASSTQ